MTRLPSQDYPRIREILHEFCEICGKTWCCDYDFPQGADTVERLIFRRKNAIERHKIICKLFHPSAGGGGEEGDGMKRHEQILHELVVNYLDFRGLLFITNPHSNVKLSIQQAVRMKRMGYKKGQPDIIILEPRGTLSGMALELKIGHNRATPEQSRWMNALKIRAFRCFVVPCGMEINDAFEWCRKHIDEYLNAL